MPRGSPAAQHLVALRRDHPAAFETSLRAALERSGGNVARAADALGVGRRTAFHWLSDECRPCGGTGFVRDARCPRCVGLGRWLPSRPIPRRP